MKLLVTGGGTGGHFYPALSVMKKLFNDEAKHQICYVGTGKGIEAKIAPRYRWIDFRKITLSGLSRNNLWRFLKGAALLPIGLFQTLQILVRFQPDVIYGTGGYVTFPAAFWGTILRIPVFTHELNVTPGLTNKILARFANKVLLSHKETENFLPKNSTTLTGTPLRDEITQPKSHPKSEEFREFGLNSNFPTVILFGGSRGSRVLVEKVLAEIKKLRNERMPFQLLIQTGNNNTKEVKGEIQETNCEKISVVNYIDNMGTAYKIADLAISRGGAGTVAELIATGTPAIIVPWEGAAENHQYFNGKLLEEQGAAKLVLEKNWPEFPLFATLKKLFASSQIDRMSKNLKSLQIPQGTEKTISVLENTLNQGETC